MHRILHDSTETFQQMYAEHVLLFVANNFTSMPNILLVTNTFRIIRKFLFSLKFVVKTVYASIVDWNKHETIEYSKVQK